MDEIISAYVLEVVTCITSISSISICIYFLYHICYESKDSLKNVDNILLGITLICFFSYTISCIVDIFSIYFDLISYQYLPLLILYYLWYCSWIIGKLSLYLVYIYRLYVIFKTSSFRYSVYKTYIPILLCWLLQAVNVVISMIYGGSWDASNDTVLICETSLLITDTILIMILLCLFLYPISKLMKTMEQYPANKNNKKYNIGAAIKYSFVSKVSQSRLSRQISMRSHMSAHSMDLTVASEISTDPQMSPPPIPMPTTNPSILSVPTTPRTPPTPTSPRSHSLEVPDPNKLGIKPKIKRNVSVEDTIGNKQYAKLLRTTAKAAILTMTALLTSFIWQLAWVITVSMNHKYYHFYAMVYTWGVDTVINMYCVLLTYPFAKSQYQRIFVDCCGLHDGIMTIIHKGISKK